MSGRAGLCGRMTNGSLALLGSGFWEQGQPTEPFIHLPGSDWAIRVGVRESRGRGRLWALPLSTGRHCHRVDQRFKGEACLSERPGLGEEQPFNLNCIENQSFSFMLIATPSLAIPHLSITFLNGIL